MKYVILVQTKSVYGRHLNYPMNEHARRFAELLGLKTLDAVTLSQITRASGFEVEYLPEGISEEEWEKSHTETKAPRAKPEGS